MAKSLDLSGHHVGYFAVSSISDQTTKLFIRELLELMHQDLEGLILDLRGNGGGYLEEAVKFLGHFIPKKELLVSSEYYGYKPLFFHSEGRGELSHLPLVVLIDQLTASAGEIIALALQERGVLVIGMPSFGKGSIQTVESFPDHSSLKFTIGDWFSPAHQSVKGSGVVPDIEISRDAELYAKKQQDNQLEKAKSTLLQAILSQ